MEIKRGDIGLRIKALMAKDAFAVFNLRSVSHMQRLKRRKLGIQGFWFMLVRNENADDSRRCDSESGCE